MPIVTHQWADNISKRLKRLPHLKQLTHENAYYRALREVLWNVSYNRPPYKEAAS